MSEPTPGPAADRELDSYEWNEVLTALTHHWRRYLLQSLLAEGGEKSCEELSAALADGPVSRPGDDVDVIERIQSQLYHVHLPKLESADLVSYDRARETVVLGRNATAAAPILTRLRGDDAVPPL